MTNAAQNLRNVLGTFNDAEATYLVKAIATHYPNGSIKVYEPKKPIKKLYPFMELHRQPKKEKKGKTSNEDSLQRSLRKSKNRINDYVLCNPFDLFVTFTFDKNKTSDRSNPVIVKRQMSDWLKNQQKRVGKFTYLIVPEYHKDKRCLHFHALLGNYKGKLIDSGHKINGRRSYNLKSYTLGFTTAQEMDNPEYISGYVRKYITKDMPQIFGKQRYWVSKGLKLPRIEENPNEWYLHKTPERVYESEYGRTLHFRTSFSLATQVYNLTQDSSELAIKGQEA